jgi:chromosome partitioning protein
MPKKLQGISLGLCNQKGGAAKTTSAAALAAIYGEHGLKVLAVDSDAQGNLSLQFGVDCLTDKSVKATIADLYLGRVAPEETITSTRFKGVDLIPASMDLAAVEILMPTLPGCDLLLYAAIESMRANYDLIILDSPPNLGKFAVNVLNASDHFLVPVDGPWALRSVDTLLKLARDNARVYKLSSKFLGVFITMSDRTRLTGGVRSEAEERFPGYLLKGEIRRSTQAREAAAMETPIPLYAADSAVAIDYRNLAQEVAERMGLDIVIRKGNKEGK